ncbi:HD domain-containing protein [Jiulongibacter sp. NS-SX5]|uniref:HD domain-containing protein n=1 Tax=Jiulongibacter sp. NS-SX5 TaxID=3463854 RepID=UPI0040590586
MKNKRKIFNDPVYGFVKIPNDLIFDLVEHKYFQRLRRIKQLGLADFVYPGALHSRFQHAVGAMHLMSQTLNALESKGIMIMDIEREAAQIAILLHDIGHGPFSHVLEYSILDGVAHESITEMIMERLNKEHNGSLQMAIQMFRNSYDRPFFHQLISSQLDMDRMDYINRDSFFTGVAEGSIGVERIIKMFTVIENRLLVEQKGLLSVENFLNARRMMYWQVYLHKTSVSAEVVLTKALERAKFLIRKGIECFCSDNLRPFLEKPVGKDLFTTNSKYLDYFLSLDDTDIWFAMKTWQNSEDHILQMLANSFVNRRLYKVALFDGKVEPELIDSLKSKLLQQGISPNNLKYYYQTGKVSNSGYIPENSSIGIYMKSGEIKEVSDASDLPTIKALGKIVEKHYLCWTNDVYLQDEIYKSRKQLV